jgi:V/A-type H+/Na+-transporting ATPase subunit E
MPEKLKELLNKINEEGIQQAEEKAGAIETKAKAEAKRIIETAEKEAQTIVERAGEGAKKTKASTEAALKQAARDIVLSLKDEIRKILDKIIAGEVRKSMSVEDLKAAIENIILKYIEKNGETSDIRVLLKKDDLEKIKGSFISKLQDKIKTGLDFKPSANIEAGFSISFDKGKSYFDFTDEGLKETLAVFLNREISDLLK